MGSTYSQSPRQPAEASPAPARARAGGPGAEPPRSDDGEAGGPLASASECAAGAAAGDLLDEFFWREDETAPGLPELLAPAPAARGHEAGEVRTEWLTFALAGEEYAVALASVREILKAPSITEVPRAPKHVLGVIMVRGEVIAIFDPRALLGLPQAAPERRARVLVCDAGGGPCGLLVDSVSQVVRLGPSSMEARPNGVGATSAEYIAGIGRERDRLFILLDLVALLRDVLPEAQG
jgi:purine-binding chemotaxis protein CheW